ncbi:hypothetical protein GL307_08990 [Nocardia seriolae]|uniref:DUF7373 family lipoprotein n=1 Tax=Nocardia seriolae TaxID=37332 RepID=UPI0012BBEB18|nr:hypothetical protein [Nocardia seriolae]MTL11757.1 hypothetical protein [Nocardia seriolae]
MASIVVAAAGLLAACGQSGHPVAGEMDVRTLDVGGNSVDRFHYDTSSNGHGDVLEGIRMAAAVAPTSKIDQSLNYGRGSFVHTEVADLVKYDGLPDLAKPILESHRFIVAFSASGSDRPDPQGSEHADPNANQVSMVLMRFGSADAAKATARELEDKDFAVAAAQNVRLTISEYPDALAHYRPGVNTIGVRMARKDFVLSIFATRPSADQRDLLSLAKRTLDAEIPSIDAFQETSADKLDTLSPDPEGLLARVITDKRETGRAPDPDTFAIYHTNWMVHAVSDQAQRKALLDRTGTDALGMVDANEIYRVRDAAAGTDLMNGFITSLGSDFSTDSAPDKVPNSRCGHWVNDRSDDAYRCYVGYRRYMGVVYAGDLAGAQKKGAAEYALLANSL